MPGTGDKYAKQRFRDFLSRKHLRLTGQRRAIIDTTFSTRQHFTAEDLLKWSRRRDKTVSRATVYRTLPLLTESGLVREIDLGKDYKFYDPNYARHPKHSHIICEDCKKVFEFENEELDRLEDEISRSLGFSVEASRLQISGRCEQLRKFGTCKRRGG